MLFSGLALRYTGPITFLENRKLVPSWYPQASIVGTAHHFGLNVKNSGKVNQNFFMEYIWKKFHIILKHLKRKKMGPKTGHWLWLLVKLNITCVIFVFSLLWFVYSWLLPIFLLQCLSFSILFRRFNTRNINVSNT